MKNTAAGKRKQVPEGYLIIGIDPHKKKHAAVAITQEQQELWLERRVLPVHTIEEASRLVGYQVVIPAYIPDGFSAGDFQLSQLGLPPQTGDEWGDGIRIVQQDWFISDNSKIRQGEPSEICGHSGKREFWDAGEGREYPLLVLHWWDDEMVYTVSGDIEYPLTEEILNSIACSIK
jgi:hypothetical protein